jgi:hypothetical protein
MENTPGKSSGRCNSLETAGETALNVQIAQRSLLALEMALKGLLIHRLAHELVKIDM